MKSDNIQKNKKNCKAATVQSVKPASGNGRILKLFMSLSLLFLVGLQGKSQNFTVLKQANATDGSTGNKTQMLLLDGYLYGVYENGGLYNGGTIFKMKTDGSGFSVLFNFNGLSGRHPEGGLVVGSDSYLYGSTAAGGSYGGGTVFKIKTDGSDFSVIKTFDNVSGYSPRGSLAADNEGFIYGTTTLGYYFDNETYDEFITSGVFKISIDGSSFSNLISFNNQYVNGNITGYNPNGLIIGPDNYLYGTNQYGGWTNGGNLYKIRTDGNDFGIVANLPNDAFSDGNILLGANGYLYGVTSGGGTNGGGVVYKVKTDGTNYLVLRNLDNGVEGGGSESNLVIGADNYLYGVTRNNAANGVGSLFKVSMTGDAEVVKVFDNAQEGSGAGSLVADAGTGILYGFTGSGAIYSSNSAPASITVSNLPADSYCANTSVNVSYSSNTAFNTGNIFNIELSDENGSFESPTVIGSYTGTATSAFMGKFPSHVTESSNYRIRVSSTDPVITGTETEGSFTIHDRPNPEVITGRGNVNTNKIYTYKAPEISGATWEWLTAASYTATDNEAKVKWTDTGATQPVMVVETNEFGCKGDTIQHAVYARNPAIENVTVSTLNPCSGSEMTVTAKVTGVFNNGLNEFAAEISDKNGNFHSHIVIGKVQTGNVGASSMITITATIPYTMRNGTGYRVRVVASEPGINGQANGQDIVIQKLSAGSDKIVNKCIGSPTDLTMLYNTEGLTVNWSTPTPEAVTEPGFYTLIVTNANGCKDTAVAEVKDYPKPQLGRDTVIKITSGTLDLTTFFNTDGLTARWNTQTPKAVSESRRYRLIVLNEGCRDTAYIRLIGPKETLSGKNGETVETVVQNKSVLLPEGKFNAAVYPNPARAGSKLQVNGSFKSYSITLADLEGKELWKSSNISESIVALPVERLASGGYIVTVNNGSEIKTLRLVKE